MRFTRIALVASLGFTVNCAHSTGKPATSATPQQESFEHQFEGMMKREAELSDTVALTSDDKLVSLRVPAAGKPTLTKASDEEYALEIPIGTEEPIHCRVATGGLDAAGTMRNLLAVLEKMNTHATTDFDAGAFGRSPWLYTGSYYSVMQNGKKLVGYFKAMVLVGNGQGVHCNHDSPGYLKTLERVMASLSDSLVVRSAQRIKSVFTEVASKLGDKPYRDNRDGIPGIRLRDGTYTT